jgi:hypothetical protein
MKRFLTMIRKTIQCVVLPCFFLFLSFETYALGAICGGLDQNCCAGGTCVAGLTCREGKCRTPCGGRDQNCCPGNTCAAPNESVEKVLLSSENDILGVT